MYVKTHDHISDIISRLLNAQKANHILLDLPNSYFVKNLVRILYMEGYIKGYQILINNFQIKTNNNNNNMNHIHVFNTILSRENNILCGKINDIFGINKNYGTFIRVYLKYKNGIPAIQQINRCSKQSQKLYICKKNIFLLKKKQPRATHILSTSCGLIVDYEAINRCIGGEYLLNIL